MNRDGYYWIRVQDGEWQPAHWYDGLWWVTGSEVPLRDDTDVEVGEKLTRG